MTKAERRRDTATASFLEQLAAAAERTRELPNGKSAFTSPVSVRDMRAHAARIRKVEP
jgi:hypothetical protein